MGSAESTCQDFARIPSIDGQGATVSTDNVEIEVTDETSGAEDEGNVLAASHKRRKVNVPRHIPHNRSDDLVRLQSQQDLFRRLCCSSKASGHKTVTIVPKTDEQRVLISKLHIIFDNQQFSASSILFTLLI